MIRVPFFIRQISTFENGIIKWYTDQVLYDGGVFEDPSSVRAKSHVALLTLLKIQTYCNFKQGECKKCLNVRNEQCVMFFVEVHVLLM